MEAGIIGYAQTKFGELWDSSLKDLLAEAGMSALKSCNMTPSDVQSLWVSNMSDRFTGQAHVNALAATALGIKAPSTRFEAACASGALALRKAYHAIKSGQYDIAMVLGAEKMTDLSMADVTTTLAGAADSESEAFYGATFPSLYALITKRYMHEYGLTRNQLSAVASKMHSYGIKNPFAQYRRAVSIEDVNRSTLVSDPLRLLDCSPVTDGGAAIILASERIAKDYDPVWIKGSGQASDTLSLFERRDICTMDATIKASIEAYNEAGAASRDIGALECHDCFSINLLLALEDLGFCKKGQAGKFVESGGIDIGGEIPTNTSGGLKSVGHPVGCTGIRQAIDIARQLKGEAFNRTGAKFGMTQNIGGSGATCVVHIFGR